VKKFIALMKEGWHFQAGGKNVQTREFERKQGSREKRKKNTFRLSTYRGRSGASAHFPKVEGAPSGRITGRGKKGVHLNFQKKKEKRRDILPWDAIRGRKQNVRGPNGASNNLTRKICF